MDDDLEFDDSEFDPAAEEEFLGEVLTDNSDFLLDEEEIVLGEHASFEELRDQEFDADSYYREIGAGWDDVE